MLSLIEIKNLEKILEISSILKKMFWAENVYINDNISELVKEVEYKLQKSYNVNYIKIAKKLQSW